MRAFSRGNSFACRKRVPLEGRPDMSTGFTTVPDGTITCDFEIEVDVEKLIRMIGARAAFSKTGISKLQGGAVTIRVVKKTRERSS